MSRIQPSLRALAAGIAALNEWIGRAISWLTVLMVIVTFLVVVLRYAFNLGWIAMQESVTYMHALVFMLGAAYTLGRDGHVRVDIFYRRLSVRGQAWIDLLGSLLLLLPVCAYVLWVSPEYVLASWSVLESSPEAGGIPAVFLLKTVIPATAVLIALQGIAMALQCVLRLAAGESAAPGGEVR